MAPVQIWYSLSVIGPNGRPARIGEAALLDVDEVLRARQERAAAQARAEHRRRILRVEQRRNQPAGQPRRMIRIDVLKQHDVGEQDLLVTVKAFAQVAPVEVVDHRQNQVQHVGAVETFALHDERFRPQQLFRRRQLHVEAEDAGRDAARDPLVVDLA